MKPVLYTLVAVSLVAALLASCTPAKPQLVRETVVVEKQSTTVVRETVAVPKERSKVTFWHIFGSGAYRDVFDKVIADFNANNPDYVVEPVFTDFWTYDQKALAAIAAGDPPDVLMTGSAGQKAEAKQIIPLDAYIQQDSFDMTLFWDYQQKAVTWKGQVWGVPFMPDTRVLFYNKDFFKEAGLDPEQPPKTWDEWYDYAVKLDKKDAAGNLVRVGFSPQWGNCWPFTILYTNGALLVDEEGRPHLTEPEVIETLYFYRKWVEHYGKETLQNFASGFGGGAQDPFISGQVAMIVQTSGYIGELQKYGGQLNWGVALVPRNRTPGSWGAGFDLEIPNGAKNPDGAWEFIKYLASKEVQLQIAKATGTMPARKDVARDPSLLEAVPGWPVIVESMEVTRSLPFVLEAPHWFGPLATAFDEVWSGVKTPEQAAADAQAAVEKEIENYKATH